MRNSLHLLSFLSSAVILAGTTPVHAQPAPAAQSTSSNEGPGYIVPDAPAMTLLGATTSAVDRPSSARQLGASFVNLITPEGRFRSGAAIDVSLRSFGVGSTLSNREYRSDYGTRFASQLSFSLATTAESGAPATAPATRIAIGARMVFLDQSDPLLDPRYYDVANVIHTQCRQQSEALDACRNGAPGAPCTAETTAYNSCQQTTAANIYRDPPRWNYGGLSLSLAQAFNINPPAGVAPGDAFRVWLTGAVPISTCMQVAATAGVETKWQGGPGAVPVGLRIRFGGTNLRGFVEGSANFTFGDGAPESTGRASLGTEVRLASDLWASASLGGEINSNSSFADLFVLSNLKWAFLPRSSF